MSKTPWDDELGRRIFSSFSTSTGSTEPWATLTTISGSIRTSTSIVKSYIKEHPEFFRTLPLRPGGAVMYGPAKEYFTVVPDQPDRVVVARGSEWTVTYRPAVVAMYTTVTDAHKIPLPPPLLRFASPGYTFGVQAERPIEHYSDDDLKKIILDHFLALETAQEEETG